MELIDDKCQEFLWHTPFNTFFWLLQVEVYQADFNAERQARERIAGEKADIEEELRKLKGRATAAPPTPVHLPMGGGGVGQTPMGGGGGVGGEGGGEGGEGSGGEQFPASGRGDQELPPGVF